MSTIDDKIYKLSFTRTDNAVTPVYLMLFNYMRNGLGEEDATKITEYKHANDRSLLQKTQHDYEMPN